MAVFDDSILACQDCSGPAISKTIILLRGVQRLWIWVSSADHQPILPMAKEAVQTEVPSQRLEENAPGGKSGSDRKKTSESPR